MARVLSRPRTSLGWAIVVLVSLGGAGYAEADERFPGTWQATMNAGGLMTTLHVVMLADGTFTTVIASDSGEMRISGTYRVVDERTIHFTNQDFAPRKQCSPAADGSTVCTSIEIPPEETDSYAFERNGQTLIIANPEAGEMRFERME